jgi:hypothetical protein
LATTPPRKLTKISWIRLLLRGGDMPDKDGKVTPADIAKIIQKKKEKQK